MSTLYPTAVDDNTTLPTPSSSDKLNNPDHASQHANANDAIKAIEGKLGTGTDEPAANQFLFGTGAGSSAWQALSSADLRAAVSDETGTGSLVFANTPTLLTPAVDTINESTGGNGVTVDGLNLKDGKLNTADSVVESSLTDGIVSNDKLKTGAGEPGGAWDTWNPTFTNLSGGTLNYAKYKEIGNKVSFRLKYTLAGAGVSGAVDFTLPVAMHSEIYANGWTPILSNVVFYDDNTTARALGNIYSVSGEATKVLINNIAADGTQAVGRSLSSTVPFTWAANDLLLISGEYERA